MTNTLTADGARRLRQVRDHIMAHPGHFNMATWDCGTYACIGGYLCRFAGEQGHNSDARLWLWEKMGFSSNLGSTAHERHPLHALFFQFKDSETIDVNRAAERINAFLWQYGFPADEVRPVEIAEPESVNVLR